MLEIKTATAIINNFSALRFAPKTEAEVKSQVYIFGLFFDDNEIFVNCFFEYIKTADKFPSHLDLAEHKEQAKTICDYWKDFDNFSKSDQQHFLSQNKHYIQKATRKGISCN